MKRSVLITGVAGFIGSSLCEKLLANYTVIGIDNLFPNYNIEYKKENLKLLKKNKNFLFYEIDIRKKRPLQSLFQKYQPAVIFHLAALTGVRSSVANPTLYHEVNTSATTSLYEIAATAGVNQFVFSSSSSVYGDSRSIPFRESQPLLPRSPYAMSKRDAEVLLKKAHHKYQLPTTILRFFSTYGPRGRPDMAPYLFTQAAFRETTIEQFGKGDSARDYTYINDVIWALEKSLRIHSRWEILNIGNSSPVKLSQLIRIIESETQKKIHRQVSTLNPYESFITYADINRAKRLLGWQPKIPFSEGMHRFIGWYKKHRPIKLKRAQDNLKRSS